MSTESVYLGIDVSKADLQVEPFDRQRTIVPNTTAGIRSLIRRMEAQQQNWIVCCEASGGYERLLVAELLRARA